MGRGATMVSLCTMHAQFVSLLAKISIPWPNQWKTVLSVLEVLNLDPRSLFGMQEWPVVDFRVLFIFVANILPLSIVILVLVLFQPPSVVAWYGLTTFAFVCIIAGLFMHFVEGMRLGVWISAAGGFVFFICMIVGGTFYWIYKMDTDEDDVKGEDAKRRQKALTFSWKRALKFLLLTCGCFFGGAVMTGMFFNLPFSNREDESLKTLGWVCYVFAVFFFLYLAAVLSYNGRKKVLKIKDFFQSNLLMVMLVAIGCSYVPIITYCIDNFLCTNYSCPAGTRFNPFAPREEGSYSKSQELFCDPCIFLDPRCGGHNGTAPMSAASVCPSFKSTRIWRAPEISCNDQSQIFFLVSSMLVMPSYLIFIPVMYIILIRRLSVFVEKHVKLIPLNPDENVEYLAPSEAYKRKVYDVEPAAASLYQPFNIHNRFYSVWMLLFRLVIVVVTNVITPFHTTASVFVLLVCHLFGVAIIVYTDPFIMPVEYALSVALESCSVLNTIYAILIMYEVELPGWFAYVLLGTNVVVPVLCAIVMMKVHKTATNAEHEMRKLEKKYSKLSMKQKMAGHRHPDDLADPLLDQEMTSPLRGGSIRGRSRAATISVPKGVPFTDNQIKAIFEERIEFTQALNIYTASVVTKAFMLIGFVLIVALGVSALGYMKSDLSSFRDGSARLRRTITYTLGDYDSWQNFTDSCCCIEGLHPPAGANLTERWICNNGVTVDHTRLDSTLKDNGLPLRSFCGTKFGLECNLWVNGSLSSLNCPKYELLIQQDVSELAQDQYW